MKKIIVLLTLSLLGYTFPIFATNQNTPNNLHIIPETTEDSGETWGAIVKNIWNWKWWTVLKKYNEEAEKIANSWNLWKAFETWVINWDTLLSYIVYLMRFLNQIGLLIWSIMILYAWYLYATTIFKWNNASTGKSAIKNAIIGILVIIFSYAILKGLEAMFL